MVKCNLNTHSRRITPQPQQRRAINPRASVQENVCVAGMLDKDVYEIKSVANQSATDFLGFRRFFGKLTSSVSDYKKAYVKNLKHTYDHKIIYALIEKELTGHVGIDSLTHDADKFVMYLCGMPKSFVSKFHRQHSSHHPESGKVMNLTSMVCDNIASSPQFKPEKKLSLRDHYAKSKELQAVKGLGEILEKYHYGDDINFGKILTLKNSKYKGVKALPTVVQKVLKVLLHV